MRLACGRSGSSAIARSRPRRCCFLHYVFVLIVEQWWTANYSPGVIRLVRDGDRPARVPDAIIPNSSGVSGMD